MLDESEMEDESLYFIVKALKYIVLTFNIISWNYKFINNVDIIN